LHFIDNNNNKYNFCWVHGKEFADRLLEDVYFKFEIKDEKLEFSGFQDSDTTDWMVQFNIPYFTKLMIESLKENNNPTLGNTPARIYLKSNKPVEYITSSSFPVYFIE